MRLCTCDGIRITRAADRLTLECLDCVGERVCCPQCGQPRCWTGAERVQTLNAAEAHRWETGHGRVVVRDAAQHILREVLGDLAGA